MPLTIQLRGRLSCPVIVCDHCGERIDSAADGNLMWCLRAGAESRPAAYTHKACCQPFEEANPGPWGANDLDTAMVYLANNLKMSNAAWERAERNARLLARL